MARQPFEWTSSDLDQLFSAKVRENLQLDYKRCASLIPDNKKNPQKVKDEISKDVSAFANSVGGTIIYGIVEDSDTKTPDKFDEGFDPGGSITQEWLEQVINFNVQRRIDGVRVHTIDHPVNQGKVLYVVWIPQSPHAPHMASDHRYYKRHGTSCLPMEEYEVRDVAGRQTVPDLRVNLHPDGSTGEWKIQNDRFSIFPSIINRARGIAEHAIITFYLDKTYTVQQSIGLRQMPQTVMDTPFGGRVMNNWRYQIHSSTNLPIWEGVNFDLEFAFTIALNNTRDRFILGCQIDTPGADSKRQWWIMSADGFNVSHTPYDAPVQGH